MRLSETITIYLAAGAPFGVACYLREHPGTHRSLALLKATGVILLWPLAMSAILFARQRRVGEAGASDQSGAEGDVGAKAEQTKRNLLTVLYELHDLVRESYGKESEEMRRTACQVRESIEKYVGLSMVVAAINPEDAPTGREMELCRIAGREGDDLLLAGRCIHRRNAARIIAHRERARREMIHALAELREIGDTDHLAVGSGAQAARLRSEAILKAYGHAINLFSLLEDEGAAMSVARLLDAECARLRRLEASRREDARERALREEQCTTHTHHLSFNPLPQKSTLNQG
jgi:hypothetical protein